MENVHGISVSGSSFPSLIWHDFMVHAVGNQPPVEFAEPKNWPVWRNWERGTEGRSHGYGYDSDDSDDYVPDESDDEEEDEGDESTSPPPPPAATPASSPAKPQKPKPTSPRSPAPPPATPVVGSPQPPLEP